MFFEEVVQCQHVEIMADLARKTSIPLATGERIYTKWGFRELLEKRAVSIVQPDLSHAGGIFEGRLIAGMAEAYYAAVAPHCPLGPISLAACLQLDAAIPNFLAQEQVNLGAGYIREPFVVQNGYLPLPTKPGFGHRTRRRSNRCPTGRAMAASRPFSPRRRRGHRPLIFISVRLHAVCNQIRARNPRNPPKVQ